MSLTKTEICNLALSHIASAPLTNVDTDTSNSAKVCRAWYNTALAEILRSHPWNFATKRKKLTVSYTNLSGSAVTNSSGLFKITSIAHGLETGDRINIKDVSGISINSQWYITKIDADNFTLDDSVFQSGYSSSTGSFVKIPVYYWAFQHTVPNDLLRLISLENIQDEFSVEDGKILAMDETIFIRYIYNVTDTTIFPNDFCNAFSMLLASYIAQPLNGPAGDGINYRKTYEQLVGPLTKIRDSREGRERIRRDTEYSDLVRMRQTSSLL